MKFFILAALVIISLVTASVYIVYVGRPLAKARCLEAATKIVDRGDDSTSSKTIAIGQEIVFNEDQYRECLRF